MLLVAVAGGGVYRAVDQGVFASGQGIAYEPWKNWRDGTTSPDRIVLSTDLFAKRCVQMAFVPGSNTTE